MATTNLESSFGYCPPGRLLWDSWFLRVPGGYRLYHLDAPHDPDPETRHSRAQIRTAFSPDLRRWTDQGYALTWGEPGTWDDGPIWTGSALKEGEAYYLYYTGRNHRDGQTQRIGLATSTDGVKWERRREPLLEADSRWYETDEPSPVFRAFRDPFVLRQEDRYLMYITAKTRNGDPAYRGCIALAEAPSPVGPWELQGPVLAPGHFAEMECPQVIPRDGRWYLFFTTMGRNYSPEWTQRVGSRQTGLHGYVADSPVGPFHPLNGDAVIAGNDSNMFSVRFVEDPREQGEYLALGWYMNDRDSERAYTLSRPYRVAWGAEGPRLAGLER